MKSNILQCLEYNYKKLGFDDFNSLSIEKIPTGKRNNCFLCTEGEKKIFCKEYNPELKWATQFNRERYDIEKEVINLLTINDCLVPKIVYADDNNKVLFLEYIE
jgi:hypothetical protein